MQRHTSKLPDLRSEISAIFAEGLKIEMPLRSVATIAAFVAAHRNVT